MKRLFLLLSAAICSALLFSFSTAPDSILQTILDKLAAYHDTRPQEKLYLQLDRPAYYAGENIWFKGYLLEAEFHNPDSSSKLVYVDLMDSLHYLVNRKVLYTTDGTVKGDFIIPDTLAEGNYLVRAYTNYMKNAGEDFFFHREISISNTKNRRLRQAAETSTALPVVQFFPEGGNLVACGRFNRVAFKATGANGRGLEVVGEIVDDRNTVVAKFASAHAGLGSFNLNPEKGRRYFARIINPAGVNEAYPLPKTLDQGYLLRVDRVGSGIKVIVFSNAVTPGSKINVVIQSRGSVYHAQEATLTGDSFVTRISGIELPDGISQITLFDNEGRPVAERLVYEHRPDNLDMLLHTDSDQYSKRSKVTLTLTAKDSEGSPVMGNFSVSVYNDDQSKECERFPITMTNYLSLVSDLKGYIENPGYYLKDTLLATRQHRDLLMMTHGWRRFTWADVLTAGTNSPQQFGREQGLTVSGTVVNSLNKSRAGGLLKIMTMSGDFVAIQPDSAGRFLTDKFFYYDSTTLIFQTENEKGKKQSGKVQLSPFAPVPVSTFPVAASEIDESTGSTVSAVSQPDFSSKVKVFDAIIVSEKSAPDTRLLGGPTDRVIETRTLSGGFHNVLQLMQTQLPGVVVTGTPPNISISIRRSAPIFMMNGSIIPSDAVPELSAEGLEKIEILQGASAVRYGGRSVVNFIYNYSGSNQPAVGISRVKYPGLYEAREFYSPRYAVPDPAQTAFDSRNTLLWKPIVKTDGDGKAKLVFYTGDVPSRYRIVVEGITMDGIPGTVTTTFIVK